MTGQPLELEVEEQIKRDDRAERIVLAALNNKTFMAQMIASFEPEEAGTCRQPWEDRSE